MNIYRCQRCEQVLAAFVTVVPGIHLPFSDEAAMAQLETRREEHAEHCPAPDKAASKGTTRVLPRVTAG